MKTTIYIDVLLALNLFINYFLLSAASRFIGVRCKRRRILAGAAVGSLIALLILIDNIHIILLSSVKLICLAVILLIAFGFQTAALFIKTILVFLSVNFIFAGIVTAVWYFITPVNMLYKNGIVYFDVSPVLLFSVTVLTYGILRLAEYILGKRSNLKQIYSLKISMNGKCTELSALYDTGNQVTDTISGMPVTVCEYDAVSNLLSYNDQLNILSFNCKGEFVNDASRFRLVPYRVVNSRGVLICIFPDKAEIGQNGIYTEIRTEVGIVTERLSQGEYRAILGANCLTNIKEVLK